MAQESQAMHKGSIHDVSDETDTSTQDFMEIPQHRDEPRSHQISQKSSVNSSVQRSEPSSIGPSMASLPLAQLGKWLDVDFQQHALDYRRQERESFVQFCDLIKHRKDVLKNPDTCPKKEDFELHKHPLKNRYNSWLGEQATRYRKLPKSKSKRDVVLRQRLLVNEASVDDNQLVRILNQTALEMVKLATQLSDATEAGEILCSPETMEDHLAKFLRLATCGPHAPNYMTSIGQMLISFQLLSSVTCRLIHSLCMDERYSSPGERTTPDPNSDDNNENRRTGSDETLKLLVRSGKVKGPHAKQALADQSRRSHVGYDFESPVQRRQSALRLSWYLKFLERSCYQILKHAPEGLSDEWNNLLNDFVGQYRMLYAYAAVYLSGYGLVTCH